ncbi:acetylglutamate kinase [Candidatus Pelagibacter sp. RS40]|uniref:acetylglutamate kinase n=1 Tax=Candidatus Pelagibacter sp. RS40 TaxID=1977865 RepID=UPI000A14E8B3|nr:acetylglutamate kinase [Candidatus Pelagibacter sp. RS40]ARJ49167.1 acetylglutamate kinase [Candidatus Pelagibacter sp. RS40]
MELEKILPNNGPSIDEVKKYTTKYSNDIIVIKCGGSVLLEKNLFNQFIEDISVINKLGLSVVVVHGGGKNIQKKLEEHNLKSAFIDGLRVTDEKTIKIVEEALLELNFEILSEINNHHANSVAISPKKNNVISVTPERKELGFVGTPTEIKKDTILEIINEKKIPLIVPMGIGEDNNIYNINADVAAGAIAKELKARRLLLMTDVEGVLDKSKNLISEINSSIANEMLKNKTIAGGMIPKIKTCLDAVNNGVTGVVIVDGRKQHSILFEIFSDKGAGTLIRK